MIAPVARLRNYLIMKRISPLATSSLFCTSHRTVPFISPNALFQCLHTTALTAATPLPTTAPGPPPPAPVPAASQYGERVDRRRRQAERLKRGQDLRASHMKPGTAMKKRFWKDVSVQTDNGTFLYTHDPNTSPFISTHKPSYHRKLTTHPPPQNPTT